ncbi:MAG TPA: hypothetical protein DEV87_06450 [Clostridiales bacterium]|nr:hypothetical protein [Clostridiales bacterium]
MKIEKIIENTQKTVESMQVSPENLIMAITKLLEITHKNGLDAEAVAALADCGITLEIKED